MPPPLAKAIGLEIKRCMLARARESTSGMVGSGGDSRGMALGSETGAGHPPSLVASRLSGLL